MLWRIVQHVASLADGHRVRASVVGRVVVPVPAPERGYEALYRRTVTQAPEGCDSDFLAKRAGR